MLKRVGLSGIDHYTMICKYTKEEIGPWKVERNGNTFAITIKSAVVPYMIAYKKEEK